jgi:hypothetical protein
LTVTSRNKKEKEEKSFFKKIQIYFAVAAVVAVVAAVVAIVR